MLERAERGELPIYTCDLETDPFARGEVPTTFVAGLFDGVTFKYFWGKDCLDKLQAHLEDGGLDPGIVYMHNGGRFDFFYLLRKFEGRSTIINSRIVVARLPVNDGARRLEKGHCFEFRDSFAIMPFPLASYRKDKLEIDKLKKANREKHKAEIVSYLKGDCVYLWELCMGFQREFGDYKTIASAAFAQLSKIHKYETLTKRQDLELRERYYFGGRVQCFREGVVSLPVQIFDTNSMYPFVMSEYFHPTGFPTTIDREIRGWNLKTGEATKDELKTFFLTVEGKNNGAFACRMPDHSVEFTIPEGVFHVTIHEFLAAMQLGLFELTRVLDSYSFIQYSKFHLFVDQYYKARKKVTAEFNAHKLRCDQCGGHSSISATEGSAGYCPVGADLVAHNLYYKYILNSAYGKFGLNPDNYSNWQITRTNEPPKGEGWTLDIITQGNFFIWKQPSQISWNVKNIGTAASITGAARSYLLRAIAKSKDVIYCDTDSLICGKFAEAPDVPVDSKALGAWKAEGAGVLTAIACKKVYAVFDDRGECIKHANKGAAISPEEIFSVAKGDLVTYYRDAPTFKMDGSAEFMHRTIKSTTKNVRPAPEVRN
jgi:DNA polymerase type B, organellar and viral